MSITGSFKSKIGLVELEIDDGGTATTVEVNDVGKLKYEFDLVPDKPEVDAVQSLYNKIDIEIFQHDIHQNDLYERLRDNLIGQAGAGVNLTIDGDVFRFFIQLNDVSIKEKDRIITLDCRVRYDPSATTLAVFDRISTEDATLIKTFKADDENFFDGNTFYPPPPELDCTGVADWIDAAMRDVFLNEYDAVIHSAETRLPQNYNQKNYTSFAGGIPNLKTGFSMVRMTSPPFSGIEEFEESRQTFLPGLVTHVGSNTFTGSGFTEDLEVGMTIELLNTAGAGVGWWDVIDIVSDEEFTAGGNVPPAFGKYLARIFGEQKRTEDLLAVNALKELAAMEGSIFGTGFGKNFYINRLEKQEVVQLEWRDVVEMESEPFFNPLGGGLVRQVARTYKSFNDDGEGEFNLGTEAFGVWPVTDGNGYFMPLITDGKSQLEEIPGNDTRINLRLAPGYPFLNKGLGKPSDGWILGRYFSPRRWDLDFAPTLALCRSGLNSIKKALSSDGSGDFIEFEIFDAKRIKPWNLVRFTGAPPKYSNKLFRPTVLEYDIVNDTVMCAAYEIVNIPSPTNEITVIGNTHASGSIVEGAEAIQVSGSSHSSGEVVINGGPVFGTDEFYVLGTEPGETQVATTWRIAKMQIDLGTGEATLLTKVDFLDLGLSMGFGSDNDMFVSKAKNGNIMTYMDDAGVGTGGPLDIHLFDSDLNLVKSIQETTWGANTTNTPQMVYFDNESNIYAILTKKDNVRIKKYNSSGVEQWASNWFEVIANNTFDRPPENHGLTFFDTSVIFICHGVSGYKMFSISKTDGSLITSNDSIPSSLDCDIPVIRRNGANTFVLGFKDNFVDEGDMYVYNSDLTLNRTVDLTSLGTTDIVLSGAQAESPAETLPDGSIMVGNVNDDRMVRLDPMTDTLVWDVGMSNPERRLTRADGNKALIARELSSQWGLTYFDTETGAITISNSDSYDNADLDEDKRSPVLGYEDWQGDEWDDVDPFATSGTTHASGAVLFSNQNVSPSGESQAGGVVQWLKTPADGEPETEEIFVGGESASSGAVTTSVT